MRLIQNLPGRLCAGKPGIAALAGLAAALALLVSFASGAGAASSGPGASSSGAGAAAGWTVQPVPVPPKDHSGELTAVSCASARGCLTVGYEPSGDDVLADDWNGSKWTPLHAKNPGGNVTLAGVSCPAAHGCVAVGWNFSNVTGAENPVAEYWNGSTWALQHLPSPGGCLESCHADDLYSVSCAAVNVCMAVGYIAGGITPLADFWSGGKWRAVRPPKVTGYPASALVGVSCVSAAACSAVGDRSGKQGSSRMLAEHWNGTAWTAEKPPSPGSKANQLNAVSCASASYCIAVGYAGSGGKSKKALAETWNGHNWTVSAVPVPARAAASGLHAVSCASATDCTATGWFSLAGQPGAALAEHWNGTAWTREQTAPSPGKKSLAALSCRGGFCMAVGHTIAANPNDDQPLSESQTG